MADYLFTSPRMGGFMKFGYSDEGVIVSFENSAVLDGTQMQYLKANFPWTISDLAKIRGREGKIEEITDTTFDTFWEKYGHKKGKVKAEMYWKKLDEGSKAKAIQSVARYKYDCKLHNREMVYPERFIKDRRFEDE